MTELLILLAFIPFASMAFESLKPIRTILGWMSFVTALVCHGFFLFLHKNDPQLWIPVASFFGLISLDIIFERRARIAPLVGTLLLGQALLSHELGIALILVAFSDFFFCSEVFFSSKEENKSLAIQSFYQSALTLLPAAVGVLLGLQGNVLMGAVAATIAFRLFSWPFTHWVLDLGKNSRLLFVAIGNVSCFALWHTQVVDAPSIWPAIWLLVAMAFSLGARYYEVFGALTLGLFSLSPAHGVLATALWPLLLHQGYLFYLVTLAVVGMGMVISDTLDVLFIQQVGAAVAVLAGAMLSRVFVPLTHQKQLKWFIEGADFLLTAALVLLSMFLFPPNFAIPGTVGPIFAGSFVLMFIIGKLLVRRKAKLYAPMPVLPPQVLSRGMIHLKVLEDGPGRTAFIQTRPWQQWILKSMESETYLIVLLGLLGAVLIWGVK